MARRRGFKPFTMPLRPPSGYYDAALDSSQGAAARGLTQLQQDTELANSRDESDFIQAQSRYGVEDSRGLADLMKERGRGQDALNRNRGQLDLNRNREQQDYGQNVADLNRRYTRLGGQQVQQTVKAGAGEGGALKQALRKRTENEAHDRAPIDLAHQRYGEDYTANVADINRRQAEFNTDTSETETRIGEDQMYRQGRLGQTAKRGIDDRNTNLTRAEGENAFYNLDLSAARFNQAKGLNYDPLEGKHPKERTIGAVTFRDLGKGQYLLPTGRRVRRAGLRKLY